MHLPLLTPLSGRLAGRLAAGGLADWLAGDQYVSPGWQLKMHQEVHWVKVTRVEGHVWLVRTPPKKLQPHVCQLEGGRSMSALLVCRCTDSNTERICRPCAAWWCQQGILHFTNH